MSTEIYDEDLVDIENIIDNNLACTFEIICKKSDFEKPFISTILNSLIQQRRVYKEGKYYFIVECKNVIEDKKDQTIPERAMEKALAELSLDKISPTLKSTKSEIITENIVGNLHRSSKSGLVAMLFYNHRNDQKYYSLKDIRNMLYPYDSDQSNALSSSIYTLCEKGYLTKSPDESKFYKWSFYYEYPFTSCIESDKNLLIRHTARKPDTKDLLKLTKKAITMINKHINRLDDDKERLLDIVKTLTI